MLVICWLLIYVGVGMLIVLVVGYIVMFDDLLYYVVLCVEWCCVGVLYVCVVGWFVVVCWLVVGC